MLTVASDRRYLCKDGVFFPYLADTAWTLLQKLTRGEILLYLDKRRSQGFNAVQVSVLSELGGLTEPNREGFLPFFENDVSRPQEGYFDLVRFLADACEQRGMVLTLLPTWGDKFFKREGTGPEVFTPQNARGYGAYLAGVIGNRENIIWMLGGDRPLETAEHRAVIDEMARGLKAGERVRHLMTFHPNGEASSADFLPDADYIDFHSIQSSHDFGGFQSHQMLADTLVRTDRPVLDAECFYEDFPIGFRLEWNYRLTPDDITRRVYSNLLAGALGHTYGHQSVWCFRTQTDAEYLYSWREALDRPMACRMKQINALLAEYDITCTEPSRCVKNRLARAGGGFLITFAEAGQPLFIEAEQEALYAVRWFDPATGVFSERRSVSGRYFTLYSPYPNDAVCILEK